MAREPMIALERHSDGSQGAPGDDRNVSRNPAFFLFSFTTIVDVRICTCEELDRTLVSNFYKPSAQYKNWLKLPMAPAISLVG